MITVRIVKIITVEQHRYVVRSTVGILKGVYFAEELIPIRNYSGQEISLSPPRDGEREYHLIPAINKDHLNSEEVVSSTAMGSCSVTIPVDPPTERVPQPTIDQVAERMHQARSKPGLDSDTVNSCTSSPNEEYCHPVQTEVGSDGAPEKATRDVVRRPDLAVMLFPDADNKETEGHAKTTLTLTTSDGAREASPDAGHHMVNSPSAAAIIASFPFAKPTSDDTDDHYDSSDADSCGSQQEWRTICDTRFGKSITAALDYAWEYSLPSITTLDRYSLPETVSRRYNDLRHKFIRTIADTDSFFSSQVYKEYERVFHKLPETPPMGYYVKSRLLWRRQIDLDKEAIAKLDCLYKISIGNMSEAFEEDFSTFVDMIGVPTLLVLVIAHDLHAPIRKASKCLFSNRAYNYGGFHLISYECREEIAKLGLPSRLFRSPRDERHETRQKEDKKRSPASTGKKN